MAEHPGAEADKDRQIQGRVRCERYHLLRGRMQDADDALFFDDLLDPPLFRREGEPSLRRLLEARTR